MEHIHLKVVSLMQWVMNGGMKTRPVGVVTSSHVVCELVVDERGVVM